MHYSSYLVAKGTGIDSLNKCGETPLCSASRWGLLNMAEFLVNRGVSINRKPGNQTPLHIAAKSGNLDLVKFLVSKGTDVNAKDHNSFIVRSYSLKNVEVYLKSIMH